MAGYVLCARQTSIMLIYLAAVFLAVVLVAVCVLFQSHHRASTPRLSCLGYSFA